MLYPGLSRPQKDLFRIREGELGAFKFVLGGEAALRFAHIRGKPVGFRTMRAAGKYIALQRGGKPVVVGASNAVR